MAATPRLTSYDEWHVGSGIEEFYRPDAGVLEQTRRRFFEAAKQPFVIEWFFGTRILVYLDDESSKAIYFTGLYEPNEFLFLSKIITPGMTFIDAGANMGLYSIFVCSISGPNGLVVAIEPSSREFNRLITNCRLNKELKIIPMNLALTDQTGVADLLVADGQHAGHNTLGFFAYSETKLEQKERVSTDTLDRIVAAQSIESIDVIKMDIEGSELLALRGSSKALERFKPVLMVELFDTALENQGGDAATVVQFLREFDYDLFEFGQGGKLAPYPLKPASSRNIVGIHRRAVDNLRARVEFQ